MNTIKDSEKEPKEQIIAAGREIFARYGFKKTTMDEIAKAVRKGKSSLYHYFKNKEDVFRAVVEKEAGELKAELIQAVNREILPQNKIRAYVLTRMQALQQLANLYSAFKEEYLESPGFIGELRENYDNYEIDMFKQILLAGIKQGIFYIRDLDLTAYAIVIASKGLEYQWAIERNPAVTEQSIDNMLEILFNGIVKR